MHLVGAGKVQAAATKRLDEADHAEVPHAGSFAAESCSGRQHSSGAEVSRSCLHLVFISCSFSRDSESFVSIAFHVFVEMSIRFLCPVVSLSCTFS